MTNLIVLISIAGAAGLLVALLVWLEKPSTKVHNIDSADLIRGLCGGEYGQEPEWRDQ